MGGRSPAPEPLRLGNWHAIEFSPESRAGETGRTDRTRHREWVYPKLKNSPAALWARSSNGDHSEGYEKSAVSEWITTKPREEKRVDVGNISGAPVDSKLWISASLHLNNHHHTLGGSGREKCLVVASVTTKQRPQASTQHNF